MFCCIECIKSGALEGAYVLQQEDVERARTRADSMEIDEWEQAETGVVYLLHE